MLSDSNEFKDRVPIKNNEVVWRQIISLGARSNSNRCKAFSYGFPGNGVQQGLRLDIIKIFICLWFEIRFLLVVVC